MHGLVDISSDGNITRNLLLLLAMSVAEMREIHNVVVFKELLMVGDVELNPGPYPPGIFVCQVSVLVHFI